MKLAQIWRHPIKSFQGELCSEVEMEPTGLKMDRAFGVIDDQSGRILTGRREPQLLFGSSRLSPEGELILDIPDAYGPLRIDVGEASSSPELNARLSDWLGRPVHLAEASDHDPVTAESYSVATDESSAIREWQLPPGRFVDSAPLLLITTQTLQSGAAIHPAGRWDVRRFRPNLVVDATGTSWLEDGWTSMRIRIGRAEIRVRKPCSRCTMVTRAQPGIEADLEVFKSLAHEHGSTFGVLCDVITGGPIRVGDELEFDR